MDVSTAGEGLINLGLGSVPRVFDQGGIFIETEALVQMVPFKELPLLDVVTTIIQKVENLIGKISNPGNEGVGLDVEVSAMQYGTEEGSNGAPSLAALDVLLGRTEAWILNTTVSG